MDGLVVHKTTDDPAQQVSDLIARQEQLLQFKKFDADVAFQLGSLLRSEYHQLHETKGIAISIELWNGSKLFSSEVGPDVTPSNWEWIKRKNNTVRQHSKSSFRVGRDLVLKGKDINSLGPEFAAHGGAFPLLLENLAYPIGVVTVSGLSQGMDHFLVAKAISKLIEQ